MTRVPLACALVIASARAALAQSAMRVELIDTAVVASPRLTEGSGIVASGRVRGVFWIHNDSGDGPRLYATDSTGRDRGAVRIAGAAARDWEDLAAGPCVVAPGRCLYIGDIGDNGARRPHVVVYRVPEPEPPSNAGDTLRVAPVLDSLVLRYPDRPHDAEALAVTGGGDLLIVTKDLTGPALLYRGTAGPGGAQQSLRAVGPLAIRTSALTGRLVTGAALAPGDSLLVVRTYVSLHFFRLHTDSAPTALGPPDGSTIPVVEAQGEGVAFDGPDRLVLISERGLANHTLLTRLRLAPAAGR